MVAFPLLPNSPLTIHHPLLPSCARWRLRPEHGASLYRILREELQQMAFGRPGLPIREFQNVLAKYRLDGALSPQVRAIAAFAAFSCLLCNL